jgi:omega-6 fatty acid desaturase / acyl-lipid omega-6 desaturase (Delta-12 desaturase)
MKTVSKDGVTSVVAQNEVIIPDLTVRDLLSAIPLVVSFSYLFGPPLTTRQYVQSSLLSAFCDPILTLCVSQLNFSSQPIVHMTVSDAPHRIWDLFLIGVIYKTTTYIEPLLTPEHLSLPSPVHYTLARFALWSLYGFTTGLVTTGLWVIAHECGHQAFSESKFINNLVGWVLHSRSVLFFFFAVPFRFPLRRRPCVVPSAKANIFRVSLGVPYHSWRITHAKHHASTGHMTQDQVFVPRTRSQRGLPPLNPNGENILGTSINEEVMKELREALGDSPIGALFGAGSYLVRYLAWFGIGYDQRLHLF